VIFLIDNSLQMESKVSFIYPTGIKVNKLVKIKDGILKQKVQREFALIKRLKAICFAKAHPQITKLTNQK
jgi:hypothetical protein